MRDKEQQFKEITEEMLALYKKKNSDYGDSVSKTYETFGMTAFLIRMEDKLNRLIALNGKEDRKVDDERIEDTLTDLANYAILARIEIERSTLKGYRTLYRHCASCGELFGTITPYFNDAPTVCSRCQLRDKSMEASVEDLEKELWAREKRDKLIHTTRKGRRKQIPITQLTYEHIKNIIAKKEREKDM